MIAARRSPGLLLLDLDGVVVFEVEAEVVAGRQIVLLHHELPRRLAELPMSVAVLTHRSRREALRILKAAGFDTASFVAVFAAEDIFRAGLSPQSVMTMARRGLRKSLILKRVHREFGIRPQQIAFIDDVAGNLDDLSASGLGLALHAPSGLASKKGSIVSFDLEEAFAVVRAWIDGPSVAGVRISLSPVDVEAKGWRMTGLDTIGQSTHPFNWARRWGTAARIALFGK